LTVTRHNHARWWTASFSSLTRGLEAGSQSEEAGTDAGIDAAIHSEHGEADIALGYVGQTESALELGLYQQFPKGARYGTLLHDLLEWQALQGWPLANANSAAPVQLAWQQLLERKTRGLNLTAQESAVLFDWLPCILRSPFPLDSAVSGVAPLVLQQLDAHSQWPEMEFNFSAAGVASAWLDGLIRSHVLPGLPRPGLQPRELQGMLTGFMDLVCKHGGRYWVLDYKSNWLSSYTNDVLNTAVLDKRYDVQYVLYVLALHRLLKSRLPGYDYDTHIGGAVYVFLRGIDGEGAGVHAMKPPKNLILQLDAAFAGGAA